MPNRILKESICTSDNLDKLSAFQETVFYRLIVNCDDFGRFDARPKLLASKLFPLKEIRINQIQAALRALTSAGLVILYEVDGKPYLQMKTWDKHQQIRTKKSKFPGAEDKNSTLISSDINCNQMISNDCLNPIQSEYESEYESNPNFSTEQTDVGSIPIFGLPLNDGSTFEISQKKYDEWLLLYPAVDIMQELRKMKGWLDSNPKKRKTKTGIVRFITGWLSRAQDAPHVDKKQTGGIDWDNI